MTELQSGQSLAGRFTLTRHLGQGGMGDVWLARDQDLGIDVVAKLVASDATPEQISLLQQECRSARRLSHPNIVRVFDFHQDPAATFITMEYVEGGNVAQLRGREPQQIIRDLLPLVDALEYAHEEGVIHRDLKSGNVLLDSSGRPRLSDFGIAGVLQPESDDLLLSGGGSRDHASPQQLAGEPPGNADDIYGLGALLVDLLGSSAPLPERLQSFLQSMLAPAPGDRPASMFVVREFLEEVADLQPSVETVPPTVVKREVRLSPPPRIADVRRSETPAVASVPDRDREAPSRHPYWWATVVLFLVLATVALGVFVWLPGWVEERPVIPEAKEVVVDSQPVAVDDEPISSASELDGDVVETETMSPEPQSTKPLAEASPAVVVPEPRIEKVPPQMPKPPRADPKAKQFAAAMTAGLRALERDEFRAAKEAFERALALSPESVEAADGLARSEQARRLAEIREHQARAVAFEQGERWHDAQREYKAALTLDATLRFAKEGRGRAASRAKLDDELEFHVAHPERLSEERVLQEARQSLEVAKSVEPSTKKLSSQIDRLQKAIRIATTPIRVVLVSDNETNVVVYKVGRLGTFASRTLDLRPGTYTVVGTREGYRDVRRQLEVQAEGENRPLSVRCEEEI